MSAVGVDTTKGDQNTPLKPLEELYYELGRGLSAMGKYEEAIDALEHVLKEDGGKAYAFRARRELAKVCRLMGNTHRALRLLLEAVAVEPEQAAGIFPDIHQLLTREAAASEWEWLKSEYSDRVNLKALSGEGQPDAELFVGRASDKTRASIALFLGRISLYAKDYAVSIKFFKEARRLTPDDARVFEGLGEALWERSRGEKNPDKTHRLMQEAMEALQRAHDLVELGHHRDRRAKIQAKRARVLAAAGKFEEALKVIEEESESLAFCIYEMSVTRSQCYLALGKPVEALKTAELAAGQNRSSAVPYVLRARALTALTAYDEALIATNRALQIDPSNLEALLCQAQALIEGQYDTGRAIRLIKHYIKQAGRDQVQATLSWPEFTVMRNDGNFHYFLAHFQRAMGQSEEASKELALALELQLRLDPSRVYPEAPALQLKAELCEEQGLKDAAFELFYEAGRRFVWRREYPNATRIFEHAVQLRDNEQPVYWYWADSLRNLSYKAEYPFVDEKVLDSALQKWEKGDRLGPPSNEFVWAYIVRALSLEAKAMLSAEKAEFLWEAVADLEKYLIVNSSNLYAWSYLARCYRNLFLDANALSASRQALVLNDKEPLVLLEHATILTAVGDETAIEFIDDNSDGLGNSKQWVEALKANAYCLKGEFQKASTLLHSAVEASPNDPWFRSLRGRALLFGGAVEKARKDFDWVWSATIPGVAFGDYNNMATRARAGYERGNFAEASSILEGIVNSTGSDPFDSRILLALCHLASNGPAKAERWFREALTFLRNKRQVIESLQDLAQLQSRLKGKSTAGEAIQKYVEEINGQTSAGVTPQSELTGIQEIKRVTDREELEPSSFAWQATQACLARMYIEVGRWSEADEIYHVLQKEPYRFPAARYSSPQLAHSADDKVSAE